MEISGPPSVAAPSLRRALPSAAWRHPSSSRPCSPGPVAVAPQVAGPWVREAGPQVEKRSWWRRGRVRTSGWDKRLVSRGWESMGVQQVRRLGWPQAWGVLLAMLQAWRQP